MAEGKMTLCEKPLHNKNFIMKFTMKHDKTVQTIEIKVRRKHSPTFDCFLKKSFVLSLIISDGGGHHGFHFLTLPPPSLKLPRDSNCCQANLRQISRNKMELDYLTGYLPSCLYFIVGHCSFYFIQKSIHFLLWSRVSPLVRGFQTRITQKSKFDS